MKGLIAIGLISGLLTGLAIRLVKSDDGNDHEAETSFPPIAPEVSTKNSSRFQATDVSSDTLNLISLLEKIPSLGVPELIELLEGNSHDYRIRNILLKRWCEIDPESALEHLQGTKNERTIWIAWGKADGIAAIEAANQENTKAQSAVIEGIAEIDPRHAIAILEENEGMSRDLLTPVLVNKIATALAKEDWQEALDFQAIHNRGYDPRLIREWSHQEPERALVWLSENHQVYHNPIFTRKIAMQVAESDPEVFARAVEETPTGMIKQIYREILEDG